MKKIIQKKLKILAKLILRKYQPQVIGITGSVGKTGAREAIFYILNQYFSVRTNPKNYNNEFGLPLTIIGSLSPGRSVGGWLKIFVKALLIILIKQKDYPKILILEMGVDRPGDMNYLTSIVRPNVSVVTAISHSHFQYFGSLEKIKKEKQRLVENTKNNGLVVLNYDDQLSREMEAASSSSVLNYGLNKEADLRALDLIFRQEENQEFFGGLHCKINYAGSTVPINLPKIMNEAGLYAVLAAMAVASYFDLNLVKIVSAFKDFSLPAGRMRLLSGINNTYIVDDSYNASPASTILAIKTLARLSVKGKKYLVLGDMLEIGDYSQTGHSLVGQQVVKSRLDYLLTKGQLVSAVNKEALAAGFNVNRSFKFFDFKSIGEFLKNNLKAGDIVLVKGSQGARMEKIVKEIMADKSQAKELLVRQESDWDL